MGNAVTYAFYANESYHMSMLESPPHEQTRWSPEYIDKDGFDVLSFVRQLFINFFYFLHIHVKPIIRVTGFGYHFAFKVLSQPFMKMSTTSTTGEQNHTASDLSSASQCEMFHQLTKWKRSVKSLGARLPDPLL